MSNSKTVLITGGSRGIGKAAVELFASKGFCVMINYCHSEKPALELREALSNNGLSVMSFKADVTNRTDIDSMVDACIARFGSIDILINNAGISRSHLFIDITDVEWDEILNVNLKSVFLCSQSVLRYMLPKKQGKIINIASIWGMVGASCEVHYSAAKAGVIGMTKALAKELGPSNIQVNCIAPGIIDTDMLSSLSESEISNLKYQTPLQRIGSPMDIAELALYLASEAGDFITGQVISPNGGFVI